MQRIIITDTHFGVKSNSVNFLNSQKLLFDELLEYIKTTKDDRIDLLHLGDIFESRSSVSIYILTKVRNILKNIYKELKKRNTENRFIFVAGNHDFYSPLSDEVCSLSTIIKDILPGATLVIKDMLVEGTDMYVPWYQMNEHLDDVNSYIDKYNIKRIFTHCDCRSLYYGKIHDVTIYAGHVHQYREYTNIAYPNSNNILYNLSTPYSLDFGDSNNDIKGFWILGESNKPVLHENKKSIKFRTLINEDLFHINDLEESIERADNYRIYITDSNMLKKEYIQKISEISNSLRYVMVSIIKQDTVVENVVVGNLDIKDILRDMLPEYLRDIFDQVEYESRNM